MSQYVNSNKLGRNAHEPSIGGQIPTQSRCSGSERRKVQIVCAGWNNQVAHTIEKRCVLTAEKSRAMLVQPCLYGRTKRYGRDSKANLAKQHRRPPRAK